MVQTTGRLFFSSREWRNAGFSEPTIEAIRRMTDFLNVVAQVDENETSLTQKQPLSTTLTGLDGIDATLGILEQTAANVFAIRALGVGAGTSVPTTTDADARYVKQDVGSAWSAPTGTASRATFATYTSPDISATYVEAEVQAIADAVQILSQRLKAIIDDLRTNGALT